MINTTIGNTVFDQVFFRGFKPPQGAYRFLKDVEVSDMGDGPSADRFYYGETGDEGHTLICMFNASQEECERVVEQCVGMHCSCSHDCCGHWFTRWGVVKQKFGYRYVRLSKGMNV